MGSNIEVELLTDSCELGHKISNPVKPRIFLKKRRILASADGLIGAN
jgi:hypothetical protein